MTQVGKCLTPSEIEAYVAKRFDELSARFRESLAPDDFRLNALVQMLNPFNELRLLELGCGKGRFTEALTCQGANVVGIDLSKALLSTAHQKGCAVTLASASRLPFQTESFDGVIAVEVLEHLTPIRLQQALSEAIRVLRPNGQLLLIDKNLLALDAKRPWLPSALIKRIDEYRDRWMYPVDAPFRERWFLPRAILGRFQTLNLVQPQLDFLLSPEEARQPLFRSVKWTRRFVLWAARKPGGFPASWN